MPCSMRDSSTRRCLPTPAANTVFSMKVGDHRIEGQRAHSSAAASCGLLAAGSPPVVAPALRFHPTTDDLLKYLFAGDGDRTRGAGRKLAARLARAHEGGRDPENHAARSSFPGIPEREGGC